MRAHTLAAKVRRIGEGRGALGIGSGHANGGKG
jgi:hypothetical protein